MSVGYFSRPAAKYARNASFSTIVASPVPVRPGTGASGEATPGERLPPAKDLAAILGVNTNTVLRALRQLRDEGLLEFRRGRGITITGTPEQSTLTERAKDLLDYARTQGYQPDELIQLIQQLG